MPSEELPTAFAPAARESHARVAEQSEEFRDSVLLRRIVDASPEVLVVLNDKRQVIYANRSLIEAVGVSCEDDICGLRPGEVLHCAHADESPGGCGTTEFCSMCGAVRAIMEALGGRESTEECRIAAGNGESMDLRVRATPLVISGSTFVVFAVVDISNEKRRKALERIFFHDILNTAGGLRGMTYLLRDADPAELGELQETVYRLSGRLIDEIQAQKELTAAENNELQPHKEPLEALELVRDLVDLYSCHEVAQGKAVRLDPRAETVTVRTDRALMGRTIGNMIKNALEASAEGDTVTVSCRPAGDQALFEVHNPTFMPRNVQLQVFQRSYTTKGSGRGLGTYSMKLLVERYLGGAVGFTSTEEGGTTFRVSLPLQAAQA